MRLSNSSLQKLYVQASKQWQRCHNLPPDTRKARIIRWLQYRGFDWSVIAMILKRLESKHPPQSTAGLSFPPRSCPITVRFENLTKIDTQHSFSPLQIFTCIASCRYVLLSICVPEIKWDSKTLLLQSVYFLVFSVEFLAPVQHFAMQLGTSTKFVCRVTSQYKSLTVLGGQRDPARPDLSHSTSSTEGKL